jgi:osmotically-inducible protein OsmY
MSEIQSKVKERIDTLLANHAQTKDYAIEAKEENGVVTLVGAVPTRDIKTLAEKLVREQEGVNSVINSLDVKDGEDEVIVPEQSEPPDLATRS